LLSASYKKNLASATQNKLSKGRLPQAGLLGGLPLAIDQVGAYIEETQESLNNSITLFFITNH
jgi:hypothetical protein